MSADKLRLSTTDIHTMLRNMLRIRRLEEKSAELYQAGKIRGFLHLYIGEEAIAAGSIPELRPDDAILTTYREHGHALLRGMSARAIMAEMFGKASGCSGGRGGSMHLFDVDLRFYGGNAIVAGHLPMAVGLALADKMQNRANVTACYFGDGAMAEGSFHESMNLAALWQVPVLFLCENNFYAMGTALERSHARTDLAARAASYGVESAVVDGMDVLKVREAVRHHVADLRAGKGPVFLELQTYRFRAHSMFDAELYRSKEEVAKWRERDPIRTSQEQAIRYGWVDEATLAGMEQEIKAELDDAVRFAEEAPWESLETLTRDVYARETRS